MENGPDLGPKVKQCTPKDEEEQWGEVLVKYKDKGNREVIMNPWMKFFHPNEAMKKNDTWKIIMKYQLKKILVTGQEY